MISRRLMLTGTAGLIALATARLVRAEALTLITARSGRMEIKRTTRNHQAEYLTGTVRIDPLFQAPNPARALARARLPSNRVPEPRGTAIRSARF
jgi:hypothetical protein